MVLSKEVHLRAVLQHAGLPMYCCKGEAHVACSEFTSEIVRLPPSSLACLLETTSMPLYMQSKWTCRKT